MVCLVCADNDHHGNIQHADRYIAQGINFAFEILSKNLANIFTKKIYKCLFLNADQNFRLIADISAFRWLCDFRILIRIQHIIDHVQFYD